MGYEEDGHIILDLEKIPIHEIRQEEPTSNFNTRGPLAKLRPYWNDFVQYKTSEEGEERVRRNQENARQKVYHHGMGSGGYATAIPKWEKWKRTFLPGYHTRITQLAQIREELIFRSWGKTGPRDREASSCPKTRKSNTKIFLCSTS